MTKIPEKDLKSRVQFRNTAAALAKRYVSDVTTKKKKEKVVEVEQL